MLSVDDFFKIPSRHPLLIDVAISKQPELNSLLDPDRETSLTSLYSVYTLATTPRFMPDAPVLFDYLCALGNAEEIQQLLETNILRQRPLSRKPFWLFWLIWRGDLELIHLALKKINADSALSTKLLTPEYIVEMRRHLIYCKNLETITWFWNKKSPSILQNEAIPYVEDLFQFLKYFRIAHGEDKSVLHDDKTVLVLNLSTPPDTQEINYILWLFATEGVKLSALHLSTLDNVQLETAMLSAHLEKLLTAFISFRDSINYFETYKDVLRSGNDKGNRFQDFCFLCYSLVQRTQGNIVSSEWDFETAQKAFGQGHSTQYIRCVANLAHLFITIGRKDTIVRSTSSAFINLARIYLGFIVRGLHAEDDKHFSKKLLAIIEGRLVPEPSLATTLAAQPASPARSAAAVASRIWDAASSFLSGSSTDSSSSTASPPPRKVSIKNN